MNISEAHENEKCIYCNQNIDGRIYSETGLKEYEISGICEICFDKLFEETEEDTCVY